MSDRFADEKAAYREALARAEAGAVEVPLETPVEPVPAEPEAVEAVEAEPVVEATEPAVEVDTSEQQTEAEKLLAGKYKTADDLEKAYLEAQAALGRQGTETGELRQAIDELRKQLATPAPEQPSRVQITEDLIYRDPAQATLLAFDQKDESALGVAFEAWKETDPFTAGQWLSERKAEQREAELRAEIAAVKGQVQEVAAPQREIAERQQWDQAFAIVIGQHPDFGDHAERILSDVAPNYPNILGSLANGDAKAKAEILTALYAIDRSEGFSTEAVREQLNEEARQAAEEARMSRAGAKVVSQETVAGNSPEQSWEEQEAERTRERYQAKANSWERNWSNRTRLS